MKKTLLFLTFVIISYFAIAQNDRAKVYFFTIDENIAKPALRKTELALNAANKTHSDYLFLQLNTFGGELDAADKIRTLLLDCNIPVIVLINKNAASAGALISLAADSIYMVPGSSIGAASVVNESGEIMPDKYQSYMRSLMRSTAEVNGRNPNIAEAMVDPDIVVPGVSAAGKILTFTSEEAVKNHFCEAEVNTREEALEAAGITNYTLQEQKLNWIDKLILFLVNPVVSGLLIMVIIGGLYFELQSPGIGFPLILSITAALLYFAPHYLSGLAQYWEIALFFVGLILLILELFLFPGFGICGISGIIIMGTALVLAMIFNINFNFSLTTPVIILQKIFLVLISITLGITTSIWLGKKLIIADTPLGSIALKTEMNKEEGYISQNMKMTELIGKIGIATTTLRPSGKIEIEGDIYDAVAQTGYIEKDTTVKIIKFDTSQLIVTIC